MTREEFVALLFRETSHLTGEKFYQTHYDSVKKVKGDVISIYEITKRRNGMPYGRSRAVYSWHGKDYKDKEELITAINNYDNEY